MKLDQGPSGELTVLDSGYTDQVLLDCVSEEYLRIKAIIYNSLNDINNIHGVADRLTSRLDSACIGSTVEVHHNSCRVGHQRLLSDEHRIRRSPAHRTGFRSSFRSSFCMYGTFRFCFLHLQTLASLNPYSDGAQRFLRLKPLLTWVTEKGEKKEIGKLEGDCTPKGLFR